MAKAQLGVQKKKKKPITRIKKGWLQKAFNYLKSDSYLFAPLFNPLPSPAAAPEIRFSGLRNEYTVRSSGRKNRGFGRDVMEYLKSDSYLYGPLLHQRSIPGYAPRARKMRIEMPMHKNAKSSVLDSPNVTTEKEDSEEGRHEVALVLPVTPERNHTTNSRDQHRKNLSLGRKDMVTPERNHTTTSRDQRRKKLSPSVGRKEMVSVTTNMVRRSPRRSRMLVVER
ncbi:hypothetical protein LINPERHAP2_LOCUS27159 [Linum perenne]